MTDQHLVRGRGFASALLMKGCSRHGLWVAGIAAALGVQWASSGASAQTAGRPVEAAAWHAPTTEPERALQAILRRADADQNQLDNLFAGRGRTAYRPTLDYGALLSPGLLAAIRQRQEQLVASDCGGGYRDGDICGMDSSPITCGQDSIEGSRYHSTAAVPDTVQVAHGRSDQLPAATYRLAKQAGHWVLDGIRCEGADTFNMGSDGK